MKFLIGALAFFLATATSIQAQDKAFDSSKFHAFDFWLGEWTVYKYGTDTIVGHSRITSIIDSLGIQEFYKTPDGSYHGTSLNKYNVNLKRWEQFWIDNSGFSLFIRGGIKEGKMVLSDAGENKVPSINRITWAPHENGTVRQTWEISKDNGETWALAFDGHYVPKE